MKGLINNYNDYIIIYILIRGFYFYLFLLLCFWSLYISFAHIFMNKYSLPVQMEHSIVNVNHEYRIQQQLQYRIVIIITENNT